MKRVNWKLPFINSSLMKSRVYNDGKNIKFLWFRNSIIPYYMIGRRIRIYNGAWALVQTITPEMIGTKFGEYSITKRLDAQQKSRMKTKKKAKKR